MGFLDTFSDGFSDTWDSFKGGISDAYNATLKPIFSSGQKAIVHTFDTVGSIEDSFSGILKNLSNPVVLVLLLGGAFIVLQKIA